MYVFNYKGNKNIEREGYASIGKGAANCVTNFDHKFFNQKTVFNFSLSMNPINPFFYKFFSSIANKFHS